MLKVMKFILGTKNGMTQLFRPDGTVVPVTRVQAGPCVVTQVKTAKKDGVNSIQVGFSEQKKFRLNKAKQGHLKDLPIVKILKEFRTDNAEGLKRGDMYTVNTFEAGDKVKVTGWSKGKGFQGVVKRHNFRGSPASHGHKDQLRMPGSIGATDPGRVFKGTRMAGHMGDAQVSVLNLEVVEVDPKENTIYIKGAVPGAKGSLLLISNVNGEIKIEIEKSKEDVKEETPVVEEKNEETKEEKTAEVKAEEIKEESDNNTK
ncbi:MAG: 50S ribosomal protein L3 [Candidatus Magasanikbacteria bacterium RIFCSPLOWO2_12_FULL_34_7]|nr:MAG: 50S ribosomal protein L3 [Candidatus Magasanikbacteria bacterium RIFCSPLOWO2_12_FULL_34_7]